MTWLMIGGGLIVSAGCSRAISRSDEPPAEPAVVEKPAYETPISANAAPGLSDANLMGRTPSMPDVAFIGLSASDLRQHTTASEGADFDPCIDGAGKVVAFASTRHSRNSHLYVKSVQGATITQVTDGPSNDAQPCFDQTGTRLAFTSDRAGQWDIWVVDINGRNPVQITSDPLPEMHPTWSADGRHIAYCRIDSAKGVSTLWVVNIDEPGVRRLIGEGMFPAWSPSGDRIAFQRARERGSRWFSIWTVELKNEEVLFPTEVAMRPDAALILPAWSPDSTQLAFSVVREGELTGTTMADIAVVDADGRAFQRLTTGESENYAPAWGADGRIYFSCRTPRTETIWSIKPFRPQGYESSPSATTTETRRAAFAEDGKE